MEQHNAIYENYQIIDIFYSLLQYMLLFFPIEIINLQSKNDVRFEVSYLGDLIQVLRNFELMKIFDLIRLMNEVLVKYLVLYQFIFLYKFFQ